MRKIFPLILISVLFASCVWIPEGKVTKFREKTTIKTFEELNEPFVFDLSIPEAFTFNGKEGNSVIHREIGSAFVVYDWENDKIFDFIYSPELGKPYNSSIVLSASKNKNGIYNYYYASSNLKRISVLNAASTEVKTFKLSDEGYGLGGIPDLTYMNADTGLVFYRKDFNLSDGSTVLGIRTINPDTNEMNPEMVITISSNCYDLNYVTDENGDYWFVYDVFSGENGRETAKICKINVTENKIEEPVITFDKHEGAIYDENEGWSYHYSYKILHADSQGFIIRKILSKNYTDEGEIILYMDFATGNVVEISKPEKMKNHHYQQFVKADGKIYAFDFISVSETGEFIDDYATTVYELDLEQKKLAVLSTDNRFCFKHFGFDSIRVRGNKIFLIDVYDYNEVRFAFFDTTTNTFSAAKKISTEDLNF